MSSDVYIASTALATPLGATLEATWSSLIRGESIVGHSRVPIEFESGLCRVNQLAGHVLADAISSVHWTASQVQSNSTAIVVATSKGGVDSWLAAPPGDVIGPKKLGVAGEGAYGLADSASYLGRQFGIGGPRLTYTAACSSGLHALIRAAMLIRDGQADRAIVVAVESSLHPLFLASFDRLGILPKPGQRCRPFDEVRSGFFVSEAAAAVCLQNVLADSTSIKLDRFAMGGDSTHLTAADPDARSLRRILKSVIYPGGIDMIHAHGTGTRMNDEIELAAIEAVLAESKSPVDCLPAVFSHKGAIGHSLGAAGLVAAVISIECHHRGMVPGNVNTGKPIPHNRVSISQHVIDRKIRRSAICAAGFGGPIAGVSLSTAR